MKDQDEEKRKRMKETGLQGVLQYQVLIHILLDFVELIFGVNRFQNYIYHRDKLRKNADR